RLVGDRDRIALARGRGLVQVGGHVGEAVLTDDLAVEGENGVAIAEPRLARRRVLVELIRGRLHVDDREDQRAEDEVGKDARGDGGKSPGPSGAIEVAL